MDTVLGKLTDLAYEFFGVILPGFLFLTFLVLWWLAVGPMIEVWTFGHVPDITLTRIGWFETVLSPTRRAEMGILLLVVCYFLGQLTNWLSRGKTGRMLLFMDPRPEGPFNTDLEPFFVEASKRISPGGAALKWRAFYPVAKSMIARHLDHSLVATYQHKYTLHRCVAASAACLFGLSSLSMVLALLCMRKGSPDWFFLTALTLGSLPVVRVFSRSYNYFWTLWGDTIVTEAYALVCGPKIEGTDGKK